MHCLVIKDLMYWGIQKDYSFECKIFECFKSVSVFQLQRSEKQCIKFDRINQSSLSFHPSAHFFLEIYLFGNVNVPVQHTVEKKICITNIF